MYEYKHEEDPTDLSIKHYKRRKHEKDPLGVGNDALFLSIREPFLYKEDVKYFEDDSAGASLPPGNKDATYFVFADMDDIYPLGYPTEQFISKIKNDVHKAFCKLKEDKKKALAAMKRELFEGGAAAMDAERSKANDKDPGFIDENNVIVDFPFEMHQSGYDVKIKTFAAIRDAVYNQFRILFKDANQLAIRPHMEYPRMVILQGKQDKVKI